MELHRHTWMLKVALIAILGIVLTACGGGDDDADPTATSEPGAAQPTVADEGDGGDEVVDLVSTPAVAPDSTPAESVPVNTDMSSPDSGVAESTPQAELSATPPASDDAVEPPAGTPDAAGEETAQSGAAEATPDPAPASDTDAAVEDPANGTPVSEDEPVEASGDVVTGDGTTGAVDASDVAGTPAASPAASPVPAEQDGAATPAAPADPVVVEGCEVADVPPYTGETTVYLLSVDVNFRAGPGADCDQIGDGPLGAFTPVEIIGGPVTRAGDDEFQWVQVQVGETTGWLAFEFLEPAEE